MIIVRKIANYLFRLMKNIRSGKLFPTAPLHGINGLEIASLPLVVKELKASGWINDISIHTRVKLTQSDLFPWENVADHAGFDWIQQATSFHHPNRSRTRFHPIDLKQAYQLWQHFMLRARIPDGWRNAGLYHACFDLTHNQWSAPDWCWTNAALVPWFCRANLHLEAKILCDKLLALQLPEGGWIVRSGHEGGEVYEIVAPNDSAYLCDHALLSWFEYSGDERYLQAALHCADWIMHQASRDFLPYLGYNQQKQQWMTHANIVDIGFTSSLFCHLFRLLHKEEHLDFAEKFLLAYIKAFYCGNGRFATALDSQGNQRGVGLFMRGQAWALEGLLPFCELCDHPILKPIAVDTVRNVICRQRHNGSWLHQWRPGILQLLSGEDSKGTPVLASALYRSQKIMPAADHSAIDQAIQKALTWCIEHTASEGPGAGGVFAWNPEGSFGLHSNVSAACIYANAYLCGLVGDMGLVD